MNKLLPQANHRISLEKARAMKERYQTHKKIILKKDYEDKKIMIDCETFNRDAFDSILAQEGCVGVRIYLAMDDALSLRAIIVGVNDKNQDILPSEGSTGTVVTNAGSDVTTGTSGYIAEDGVICPPECPTPPSL